MPNGVKDFLSTYPDVPWQAMTCPTCGRWYSWIDPFAPHLMDMNFCNRCDK